MFKLQSRNISLSAITRAAVPGKGKAQGFSKKKGSERKSTTKRITDNTLYKKWINTVHTAKFNRNAPVMSLPKYTPNDMDSCVGKVVKFSEQQCKSLHHLGSFKKDQFNELFNAPISLIRHESANLQESITKSKSKRIIITGEPGIGKTTLLSHIHANALGLNSIVINISYPQLFLNGRNDFFLDEESKLYIQPMYLKKFIRKILKANDEKILASVKLSDSYTFSRTTMKGATNITLHRGSSTLFDLLSSSVNANVRGKQYQAIMKELYGQPNIPICFTIDNFSSILTQPFSEYRDVENKNIYALDLQIGKTIMDLVSGEVPFLNPKSCLVMAISGVDRTNRTLPVALGKLPEDPYVTRYHYEPNFAKIMKKGMVEEFEVTKMGKDEVRTLLRFYSDAKIILKRELQTKTLENLSEEKYFLSGNGNPRELLKSIVLTHK
ncbi:hypothetical protein KAFR_0K02350 [Kazachstania africana CBS 2517]|uniref:Small ribosomal subunit protein mS29 n=1 Tax=Kazachstania africana (strain ATCC 22294 / BCRC 22015 / CBS 2517 / CECT 1963 / NBRC 1671 / NRRL Y-8276) TaxID=1071382 RepID=H2B1U0_KAZAF|nr:hypothetical protein KAFR_0K02350 [Kazachstania africana CBS 2517]CCF60590.1 hypothetical protein KAFR_0K02350 [Kazachstania africana CBS 2517]